MYIEVECQACQKTYKAPESLAGKYVKCKGCGAPLLVRDPNLPDLDDTAAGHNLAFDVKEDDAPERGTVADTRPPLVPEIVTEMLLPLLLIVGGVGWAGYLSVMACLHSTNPVIAFIFLGLAVGLLLLMVTPLTIRAIESSSKSLDYDLPNAVWLQAFSMLVVPTAGMTIGWFQNENHVLGLITGLVIGIFVMGVLLALFYRVTPVQAAITTIFAGLVYLCTSGVVVGICAVLAVILSMSNNQLPWQKKEIIAQDTSVRTSGPIAATRSVVSEPTSAPAPVVVAPTPQPIVVAPTVPQAALEPQWVACVDPAPSAAKWPNEVQRPIQIKPPVTIAHSYFPSPFVALMDQDSVDVYDIRTNKRVGFMKQPMKPTSAYLNSTGADLAAVFGYGAGGQTPSIQVWEVANMRPMMQIRPDSGTLMPTLVGWAGDDKIVTTGVRAGLPLVQLWDVKKGVPVHEMNVQGTFMPNATAVSPGGKYFAYTWGGKIHLYDLTTGDLMGKTDFASSAMAVKALKFSPDGAEIAGLATDMVSPPHLMIVDLTSGKKTTDVMIQGSSGRPDLAPERFHFSPGCIAFLVDSDWVDRTSGRVMSTLQPLTLPIATGKACMLINDFTALMEATPTANGDRVIYKSVNLPKAEIESALKTVNGTLPVPRTGVVASAAPTTSSGGTEDVAIADPGGSKIGGPTSTPGAASSPKMATASMAGQKEWIVTVIAVNKTDEAAIDQQITAAQDRMKQIEKELVTANATKVQMNRMSTSVDAYGRSRSVPMYPEAERAKANLAVSHLEDERRDLKGTVVRLEKSKEAAKTTRMITARSDEGVAFEITAEGPAMITIAETMQPDSKWKVGGFGRVVEGVLNVKLQKATAEK